MTGLNHAITGAVIGAAIGTPIVALPLAFASHFVLDALPHYGDHRVAHTSRRFHMLIIVDTIVTTLLLLFVVIARPQRWLVMVASGLIAMSPDLMWLPNYWRTLRKRAAKSYNKLMHLHENIQREQPWGYVVEAAWLLLLLPIFWAEL